MPINSSNPFLACRINAIISSFTYRQTTAIAQISKPGYSISHWGWIADTFYESYVVTKPTGKAWLHDRYLFLKRFFITDNAIPSIIKGFYWSKRKQPQYGCALERISLVDNIQYSIHRDRIESVQNNFLIFALWGPNWDEDLRVPSYTNRLWLLLFTVLSRP